MKTQMIVTARELEAEGVVVLPKRLETSAIANGTVVQALSQTHNGLSFASPQIAVQNNVSPTIALGWF
jgi:predicted RecA/RadA family phage recombinase